MINVDIKWDKSNIAECYAAFNRLLDESKDGSRDFVNNMATRIYKESQLLVPVRSGKLKKSGKVNRSLSSSGTKFTAEVSYGGNDTLNKQGRDYAIFAHDIPPNRGGSGNTGNKHKPPTSYKYLERPALLEISHADPVLYSNLSSRFNRVWHN